MRRSNNDYKMIILPQLFSVQVLEYTNKYRDGEFQCKGMKIERILRFGNCKQNLTFLSKASTYTSKYPYQSSTDSAKEFKDTSYI